MRQFKLWNATRTEAFDFAAQGCVITDVTGLGIGFAIGIQNGAVVEYDKSFDDITLLANFGVKANAYTSFNTFANFIAANGKQKLVLEYAVNGRTLFADVWMKNLPKTQKTNFNILSEKLVFQRITYWYEVVNGTIPASPGSVTVINLLDDIPVNFTINGPVAADFEVQLKDVFNAVVSRIKILGAIVAEDNLAFDAENKRVSYKDSGAGVTVNGYNMVDKTHDTFLVIPRGTYKFQTNSTATPVAYLYKKWVID